MSEAEWDAPNQQVVRADQSAPWEEGTGGAPPIDESGGEVDPAPEAAPEAELSLDEMTKDQLLAHAQAIGASPANHAMTKDEIRASIDEKLAEGG